MIVTVEMITRGLRWFIICCSSLTVVASQLSQCHMGNNRPFVLVLLAMTSLTLCEEIGSNEKADRAT